MQFDIKPLEVDWEPIEIDWEPLEVDWEPMEFILEPGEPKTNPRRTKDEQRANQVKVIRCVMPDTIRGCTVQDKGSYMILINECLSAEEVQETLRHEMDHIRYNDFKCGLSVGEIETIRHKE